MDILKIDTEKQIVTVEPLVSIRRLMEALVPMGWTVPIVPEIGNNSILKSCISKIKKLILISSQR